MCMLTCSLGVMLQHDALAPCEVTERSNVQGTWSSVVLPLLDQHEGKCVVLPAWLGGNCKQYFTDTGRAWLLLKKLGQQRYAAMACTHDGMSVCHPKVLADASTSVHWKSAYRTRVGHVTLAACQTQEFWKEASKCEVHFDSAKDIELEEASYILAS